MSNFVDNNEEDENYLYDDQDLLEVEVDDNRPDDESVNSDVMDADNDQPVEYVEDMAFASFKGHTDSVYCASIHPTNPGLVITGGGDDVAYIWKYAGPNQISTSIKLSGHTDTVTAVGFNFNGKLALTGSYDGTVRIWNVESGELMQTLEGPEDVEWAQWHGKGNVVIAGSTDGTIWQWMAHDGSCMHVFAGHEGSVTCGAFSKDGSMIFTGGEDGTVRVWMPKSGQSRAVFQSRMDGQAGEGFESSVTCLTSNTHKNNASQSTEEILTCLAGSSDGTVKLFQVKPQPRLLQTFIHSVPGADGGNNSSSSAAPNAAMRAVKEGANEDEEGEEDDEGMEVDEDGDEVQGVECVGFANNTGNNALWSKWVASGGMDRNLKVWDSDNGMLRCSCPHGGSVVSLVWHSTLPFIATAALDNVVRIWDARVGVVLKQFTGHTDLVTAIEMLPITDANRIQVTEAVAAAAAADHNASVTQQEADDASAGGAPILVTAADMLASAQAEVNEATDVIVSVSDDKTARVFLFNAHSLAK